MRVGSPTEWRGVRLVSIVSVRHEARAVLLIAERSKDGDFLECCGEISSRVSRVAILRGVPHPRNFQFGVGEAVPQDDARARYPTFP